MSLGQFNTRDGAKIGRSFHEQVAQVNERHPGYDEVIFAMCFGPLIDGMRSEKAKLWMQCSGGNSMRPFREPGAPPPEKPPVIPVFLRANDPPIRKVPIKPKDLVIGHWPVKGF
ncbi:MAG: hypothetical protein B7Y73_02985 [Acidocella sp. 35-58-6]|nr:MAG: hypothetical protein B7Y73_02985 [Acidocella sp. 35-58-6]